MTTAAILSVGTELLLGEVVDTNAAFLSAALAGMGIAVYHRRTVGDNPGRLEQTLRELLREAQLVVVSGGLGDTDDDITKEVAARVLGVQLVYDPASDRRIDEYFRLQGRPRTAGHHKQAMVPPAGSGEVFPNPVGTAPGVAIEAGGRTAVLLPGPPSELEPMFRASAAPYLQRFSQQVFRSRTLRLFGISESGAARQVAAMMEGANPTLAPYAKTGEVHLRITACGPDEAVARRLIAPMEQAVREKVGQYVYGVDDTTLEAAAVAALQARGLHVATAESCTGGGVSAAITSVPGASEVFGYGVCCYSEEAKCRLAGVDPALLARHSVYSAEAAAAMAAGVRRLSGAEIGIATTGLAGPGGGTEALPVGSVWVAVDAPWHSEVLALRLASSRAGDGRARIVALAVKHALSLLLRTALSAPAAEKA